MTPKDRYRKLCETEDSIPIFSRAWWLDATAGEHQWYVAVIEKDGLIVASMPYMKKNRFGFTLLTQPHLTQKLGPWIRPSKAKYAKRLAQEKDLLQGLIEQLPSFDNFVQNWDHTQQNWLPLYWCGYQQSTRYTYRLPDLSSEVELWKSMQPKIRTDIKKAQNRFGLCVREAISVAEFYELNCKTFVRQNMVAPYSLEQIERVDKACVENNARKIFVAEDKEGQLHAGVYLIWDKNSAYYLMGGGDPALRNSGATSLCLWEAIRYASTVTKSFDFEGSMIESIERFFRAFGAVQTPYFEISKTPSRLLELRKSALNILHAK